MVILKIPGRLLWTSICRVISPEQAEQIEIKGFSFYNQLNSIIYLFSLMHNHNQESNSTWGSFCGCSFHGTWIQRDPLLQPTTHRMFHWPLSQLLLLKNWLLESLIICWLFKYQWFLIGCTDSQLGWIQFGLLSRKTAISLVSCTVWPNTCKECLAKSVSPLIWSRNSGGKTIFHWSTRTEHLQIPPNKTHHYKIAMGMSSKKTYLF